MLLERNREKGLPNPITADVLLRFGVPDSIVPRTLQMLKTLDLVGPDGKNTETLDILRRAPEAEYQGLMAEWLKGAYEHTLDIIDPATATDTQIRDAFRHYNPVSLQPRMIKLFTTLFEVAGVRVASEAKSAPKKTAANVVARTPARPLPRPKFVQALASSQQVGGGSGLHPALGGLLASLPAPEVGWTQEARDRFVTAFGVVLDFAYPPGLRQTANDAEAEDADA
jgi:hypothetical protein